MILYKLGGGGSVGKDVEQKERLHSASGIIASPATLENCLAGPAKH